MNLMICTLSLLLFTQSALYAMEAKTDDQTDITSQLAQLSVDSKVEQEQLDALKQEIDNKREDFKAYVKRTKNQIKNPVSKMAIMIGKKIYKAKKKNKGFMGIVGAEPADLEFVKPFLDKSNKTKREKAIDELGKNIQDLLCINKIIKFKEESTSKQIEQQRIDKIHEQVVIYLKEPSGINKKELREKVQNGKIACQGR